MSKNYLNRHVFKKVTGITSKHRKIFSSLPSRTGSWNKQVSYSNAGSDAEEPWALLGDTKWYGHLARQPAGPSDGSALHFSKRKENTSLHKIVLSVGWGDGSVAKSARIVGMRTRVGVSIGHGCMHLSFQHQGWVETGRSQEPAGQSASRKQ